jgi:hypothetical protein
MGLAATAAVGLTLLRDIGGINHPVARAFDSCFELLGRGRALVVLHDGRALREQNLYVADSGNSGQRLRHFAGAAAAGHPGYGQVFCVHFAVPYQGVK